MRNPSIGQWAVFDELQNSPEPPGADECLGREEALSELLNDIAVDSTMSDERMRSRFATLSRNRGNKYRHRRQIEHDQNLPSHRRGGRYVGPPALRPWSPDVSDQLGWRQLAEAVATFVTPDEFALLWEIAKGTSYEDAAVAHDTTVSSLKSRVFRIRARVRESSLGPSLREALE